VLHSFALLTVRVGQGPVERSCCVPYLTKGKHVLAISFFVLLFLPQIIVPTGLRECCQYQYRRRFDCSSIILSRHAPVRVADGSFGRRGGDLARKCTLNREGQCMMWAKDLKKMQLM